MWLSRKPSPLACSPSQKVGIGGTPLPSGSRCGECDVALAEAVAPCLLPQPEGGHRRHAVADHAGELHDPLAADGGQNLVVEPGAGLQVGALNGEMVEHGFDHRT
jgi:hypothetical protein